MCSAILYQILTDNRYWKSRRLARFEATNEWHGTAVVRDLSPNSLEVILIPSPSWTVEAGPTADIIYYSWRSRSRWDWGTGWWAWTTNTPTSITDALAGEDSCEWKESTFLHGNLDEEGYMRLPKEVDEQGRRPVVRLTNALYGFKQGAGMMRLTGGCNSKDGKPVRKMLVSTSRKTMKTKVSMMLYIHVDDSAIAAKDKASIHAFVDYLDQLLCRQEVVHLLQFMVIETLRAC